MKNNSNFNYSILEKYMRLRPHDLEIDPEPELIDLSEPDGDDDELEDGTNIKDCPVNKSRLGTNIKDCPEDKINSLKLLRDKQFVPGTNINHCPDIIAGTNMIVPGQTLTTNNITTNNITTQQLNLRPKSEDAVGLITSASPRASWPENKKQEPAENTHNELLPGVEGMKFDLFFNPGGANRNKKSNYRLCLLLKGPNGQIQLRAGLNSPLNKLLRSVDDPNNAHWQRVIWLKQQLEQIIPDEALKASKFTKPKNGGIVQDLTVFVFKQDTWQVLLVYKGHIYAYDLIDTVTERFVEKNGAATLVLGHIYTKTKGFNLEDLI
ncbi:hypothetical protein EB118_22905 [bacterium]|nr:hypothetical protein [bacterium]